MIKKIFLLFFGGLIFAPVSLFSSVDSARNLVHLLNYIASDYPGAVHNGKVISQTEYEEQVEFSLSLIQMAQSEKMFQESQTIVPELKELRKLVLEKASKEKVRNAADNIKTQVFLISGLQQAPRKWPNLQHGKDLYSKNCVQCHGMNGHGDGPSSGSLDPKPANFFDAKNDFISPFQFFNAIRLGVQGTSMAAFEWFSETETWDLAFYLASLRHQGKNRAELLTHPWTLEQVASLSDTELSKITPAPENLESALALARTFDVAEGSENSLISLTNKNLDEAFEAFKNKNFEVAKSKAIAAYLEGVEPLEPKLRLNDPEYTLKLEESLASFRKLIDQRVEVVELEKSFQKNKGLLKEAQKVLETKPSSFWVTFSVASGIFLREALEAALLLITLLGVVRSIGNSRAALYIHGGWIAAFVVGLSSWFFSGWIVKLSGLGRELLEGSISMMAVGVLLYFGFWLHRKTEIGKWRAFINQLVKSALDNKKLFGLAVVAFMGVFREAFETVLFLRALLIESPGQDMAITLGVASSFVLVLIASAGAIKYSAKLPLKQLFSLSSAMMLFLSFILIGKSIHAFQEAGVFSANLAPGFGRVDWLGVFPTWETLIPQMILLTVSLMVWIKPKLKRKPQSCHS
jgi:high-affinity iron transporter